MNAKSIMAIGRRRLVALPLLALALGLAQVGAARAEVVQNEWVPTSADITNPCTGTTDVVEGLIHFQARRTVSPSGQAHIGGIGSLNLQGDILSIIEVLIFRLSGDLSDVAPYNATQLHWIKFIEQGVATNAYQQVLLHTTINANGDEISLKMELGDTECRG